LLSGALSPDEAAAKIGIFTDGKIFTYEHICRDGIVRSFDQYHPLFGIVSLLMMFPRIVDNAVEENTGRTFLKSKVRVIDVDLENTLKNKLYVSNNKEKSNYLKRKRLFVSRNSESWKVVGDITDIKLDHYKLYVEEMLASVYSEDMFEDTISYIHLAEDLTDEINEISKQSCVYVYPLTHFFICAVKHNRDDLFNQTGFKQLFNAFNKAAITSVISAVVYGNSTFCIRALEQVSDDELRLKQFSKVASYMAILKHDNELLKQVAEYLSRKNIAFNELDLNKNSRAFDYDEDLLYWAVHLNNAPATTFLLERGFNSNNPYCHFDAEGGCFFIACRSDNIKMMEILYSHGADIEKRAICADNNTPLLVAIISKRWERVIILIEKFGANIYAANAQGELAIDLINDAHLKVRLEKSYHQRRGMVSQLGFMSPSGREPSAQTGQTHYRCCIM